MGYGEPTLVIPQSKVLDPRAGKSTGGADPFFSQVNTELADKGFLVAAAHDLTSGRKNVNAANENVMPAFGTNKNVMCVIDDLYVYLRARANDAVPRGRPAKHEEKPEAAANWQNSCFGQS